MAPNPPRNYRGQTAREAMEAHGRATARWFMVLAFVIGMVAGVVFGLAGR